MITDEQISAPAADSATIILVHHDERGDALYWAGLTNGHDGQGWTAERAEAMEFPTFAAANLERNRARKTHPGMRIMLEGSWMGGGE